MIKKTVRYIDFNQQSQVEELYFHVTPSEWIGRSIGEDRTFAEKVKEVMDQGRVETLMGTPEGKHMQELFEDIIISAYGTKSDDGKRFIKSPILRDEFKQTAAYGQLFIDLVIDPVAMAAFIDALIPPEIRAAVDAQPTPPPLMAVPALAPVETAPVDAPQPASKRIMSYEEYVASQNPDNLQ